jgi:uncharacterized GH25 family protein
MKNKILVLLITMFAFGVSKSFSHTLWIQTSGTGKKGQQQEVKVLFREYAENKPDSTEKWSY